ncbi:condensation domain-containing protein, partial [Flavobacterium collinsii]
MFSISESDLDISIGIGYCTALFERSTIDRMLLHYKELLLSIVRDIRQPISDLGMLTKEEEYQLLHLFNDTRVA